MADLSQLSDEELRRIASGQQSFNNTLANMSNDQLVAIAGRTNPEDSLPTKMPLGPWETPIPLNKNVAAFLVGGGKTTARIGQGMQQLANDSPELKARVAEEQRLYDPLAKAFPMSTGLGESLPAMAIPIGGAAGVAGVMGRTALASAVPAALEYGSLSERAKNTALAGGAGALGGAFGAAAGRVLQPVRAATANVVADLFGRNGLPALPSQITGSKTLGWIEDAAASLPGGSRIRNIAEQQQTGLNRVATGAMGKADDMFTPEAVNAAKQTVGQKFQNIPAATTVGVDRTLAQRLLAVEPNHYKNLSPDQRSIVKTYVDDILNFGPSGMPGDVYQKARSRIGARAESTQDSELKTALKGVQKSLDDAFERSASPADNAAYAEAREQWRAIKDLGNLTNVDGRLSPARAATAGKNAPAGSAEREVAELGAKMRPLRSSGTAERLMYQSLLTGGAGGAAGYLGDPASAAKWGAGSLVAPWIVSQLLTRRPVMPYLTKGLLQVTPEIEKKLIRYGGLLGLSGANAVSQ
jgi:hypothetical protein